MDRASSSGLSTPVPRFNTCVQIIVVPTWLCPSSSWMVRMSCPWSSKCVAVGRDRGAVAIGEPGQKLVDLGGPHLARMTQAMEPDKPAHPVDVGLLGS